MFGQTKLVHQYGDSVH